MNVNLNNQVDLHPTGDIKIPLTNLGNLIDFSGECVLDDTIECTIEPESHWQNEYIELINGLNKAPYKRRLISKQIYTGHLRIDLNQPMAENN